MRSEIFSTELTRRRLLEIAAATAGGALSVPLLDPVAGLGAAPRWPSAPLPAHAARHIDPSQFLPASQLFAWQDQLDRMGLRATGSPVHERFVDQLHDRLGRAGVRRLRFESVPLDRWTIKTWSLRLSSGGSAGEVATASYIPYSERRLRPPMAGDR